MHALESTETTKGIGVMREMLQLAAVRSHLSF